MSDQQRAQAFFNALVGGTKESSDTPARTGRTPNDTNPFEGLKAGEIWVSFENGRAAVRADNSRFGLDSAGVYVYIAEQVQPDNGFIITRLDIDRNDAAFGGAARNLLPGSTRWVSPTQFLPGLVLPDSTNAGLTVRILALEYPGGRYDEAIEPIAPTSTSGKSSFVVVGVEIDTGNFVQYLTADSDAPVRADVQTILDANAGVFWLAYILVANGATALSPENFFDLRFFTNSPGNASGDAHANARYVTAASNGAVTDETVIPGIIANADISGAAGAGTSEEYDTTTTGLTWTPSTPATVDSDTTIQSHLYVSSTDATERLGLKAWSPAGAFDARCKISRGGDSTTPGSFDFIITDSGNSNRVMFGFGVDTLKYIVNAYTYTASTYTQRGSNWTVGTNFIYGRIVRDGGNNISFYWSTDGIMWQLIATQAFTFTVANIGFRSANAANIGAADWLRTNV